MQLESWIQITAICLLGAMSPGPSLAIVATNTIAKGRMYGVFTSLGHGVGIGVWALLTAVGVAKVIASDSVVSLAMQSLGAILIAYVGYMTITNRTWNLGREKHTQTDNSRNLVKGTSEGFLISIFNPKIALFFIAIFSHFVSPEYNVPEIILIGSTAALIDAMWYVLISIVLTTSKLGRFLEEKGSKLSLISGFALILIAIYLASQVVNHLVGTA